MQSEERNAPWNIKDNFTKVNYTLSLCISLERSLIVPDDDEKIYSVNEHVQNILKKIAKEYDLEDMSIDDINIELE